MVTWPEAVSSAVSSDAFRLVFDEAPIGIGLVAPDGRWLRINRSACEFFGYSEQELLGRRFQDVTHPDDVAASSDLSRRLLGGQLRFGQLEKRYLRKEGRVVWSRTSVSLVCTDRNEPLYFITHLADITEQREAEERYGLVVETLAEGVVLFDEQGHNVQTNPAAERMIGASQDQVSGALATDRRWRMVREDGSEFAPEELPAEITRTTGEPQTGVVMGMHSPSGTLHWLAVSTRVIGQQDEPPYRVVASFDDISLLKRAEHEAQRRLVELERTSGQDISVLEALVAQSDVGLAFMDLGLRFVHINDALARINQLPVEAHIGRTPLELFGEHGRQIQELVASVRDRQEPLNDFELTMWFGAEGLSTYRLSYWPVRSRTGKLLGVSTMVTDITGAKAAEREREELLRRERRTAERVARLQRVTSALAGALGVSDVAGVLVREAAAAIGVSTGWVALLSPDRRALDCVASMGFPHGIAERYGRVSSSEHRPGNDALSTGRSLYFTSAQDVAQRYPEIAGLYAQAGNQAGAIVPIMGTTSPLGIIGLTAAEPREFSSEDRTLLETIARQCAQALERALLYEREHTTAQTLSQSLLPDRLPEISGVTLACRYEPTPRLGSGVGGDFYDVFPVGSSRWLLVIGDVAGKGAAAAALTSLVRYTTRAEAAHNSRPSRLLAVVNEAIRSQQSTGLLCTMACARLDLSNPRASLLELATAGHPPPLLVHPDGSAEVTGATGDLLGAFRDASGHMQRVELTSGTTLVLYTDGLLEANAPERALTPNDLAEQVSARAAHDPQTLIDGLYRFALRPDAVPPNDDVAILAARISPPSGDNARSER